MSNLHLIAMEICFWVIGKTNASHLKEGEQEYLKRLPHYTKFSYEQWPDIKRSKKMGTDEVKRLEGDMILGKLNTSDHLVLLDEKGKTFNSEAWAQQLQKWMNASPKRLIFLVGGAFGFSPEVYQRAQGKIALSAMTFSHQMVRMIFLEQLYRGFSILNNEPYHHT